MLGVQPVYSPLSKKYYCLIHKCKTEQEGGYDTMTECWHHMIQKGHEIVEKKAPCPHRCRTFDNQNDYDSHLADHFNKAKSLELEDSTRIHSIVEPVKRFGRDDVWPILLPSKKCESCNQFHHSKYKWRFDRAHKQEKLEEVCKDYKTNLKHPITQAKECKDKLARFGKGTYERYKDITDYKKYKGVDKNDDERRSHKEFHCKRRYYLETKQVNTRPIYTKKGLEDDEMIDASIETKISTYCTHKACKGSCKIENDKCLICKTRSSHKEFHCKKRYYYETKQVNARLTTYTKVWIEDDEMVDADLNYKWGTYCNHVDCNKDEDESKGTCKALTFVNYKDCPYLNPKPTAKIHTGLLK